MALAGLKPRRPHVDIPRAGSHWAIGVLALGADMAEPYELQWNTGGTRLSFTLHGLWTSETAARWESAYRAAVLRAPRTAWTVVGDLSDYPPQNEQVQAVHEALMAFSAQKGMVRGALIVPKAVAALQMKRLANGASATEVIRFVSTTKEAEAALAA